MAFQGKAVFVNESGINDEALLVMWIGNSNTIVSTTNGHTLLARGRSTLIGGPAFAGPSDMLAAVTTSLPASAYEFWLTAAAGLVSGQPPSSLYSIQRREMFVMQTIR